MGTHVGQLCDDGGDGVLRDGCTAADADPRACMSVSCAMMVATWGSRIGMPHWRRI
jgi:hypothetical protein